MYSLARSISRSIRVTYPTAWVMICAGGDLQRAGAPDLLIVVRGKMIALQVRTPDMEGFRVPALQEHQLNELRRAGAAVAVIHTPREALKFVDGIFGYSFTS